MFCWWYLSLKLSAINLIQVQRKKILILFHFKLQQDLFVLSFFIIIILEAVFIVLSTQRNTLFSIIFSWQPNTLLIAELNFLRKKKQSIILDRIYSNSFLGEDDLDPPTSTLESWHYWYVLPMSWFYAILGTETRGSVHVASTLWKVSENPNST